MPEKEKLVFFHREEIFSSETNKKNETRSLKIEKINALPSFWKSRKRDGKVGRASTERGTKLFNNNEHRKTREMGFVMLEQDDDDDDDDDDMQKRLFSSLV